jgi:hypothetical protein
MQEVFEYSEKSLRTLERALSPERLKPYMIIGRGDLWVALHLYTRNTELSEALYGIVQGFEILLRNATHVALSKGFATEQWWDLAGLREQEQNDIAEARRQIAERLTEVTPGRVVAELNFGFWANLYSNFYEQGFWVKHLRSVFPARLSRKVFHDRLTVLKLLRNRIAHHETLIRRDVRQDYTNLLETAGWISYTTQMWIESTNCFEERVAKRLPTRTKTIVQEPAPSSGPATL